MATAALHAAGYRTNSNAPGHHAITVESMAHTFGADAALVREFDAFRRKRNRVSYDAPAAGAHRRASGSRRNCIAVR